MSTKTQDQQDVDILDKQSNRLILYNDDVNTFDHVIECLIRYCQHTEHQAEQCALIVHYNGKCQVKEGDFEELHVLKEKLESEQLTCVIE